MRTRISLLFLILMLLCGTAWCVNYTQDGSCEVAYLLNESSGVTVDDASPNARDGTFVPNTPWGYVGATGVFGTAYRLWQSAYIVSTDIDLTSAMTAVFFVNHFYTPSEVGVIQAYVNKWDGDAYLIRAHTDNKVYFYGNFNGNVNGVATTSTVEDGYYHHIATTYDASGGSNNQIIYYDGNSQGTSTQTGNITTNNNNLLLGSTGMTEGPTAFFDEVAIFNRALSSTEINDIMDNGLVGGTTVTGQIISVNVT